MRALVTGAAGFIGSHLAERLTGAGHEVVGVDTFTPFYKRSLKARNLDGLLTTPTFILVELDLSRDPLDDLLDDVDVVYHLAAQPGVRKSFGESFGDYVRHNIHGTQRLLEAAVGRPLRRFVYASSSSVYGTPHRMPTPEDEERRPESPYGMTKAATEDLAGVYHRGFGVPVVGLRYFTVYGPRQRPDMAFSRFIEAALAERPLVLYGDGRQTRDFTYVEDTVTATIAAGERGAPGRTYNVGGGQPVLLLDVLGCLDRLIPRLRVERQPPMVGDVRSTCADGSLAAEDLGFAPSTSLEEGLAAQVEFLSESSRGLAVTSVVP